MRAVTRVNAAKASRCYMWELTRSPFGESWYDLIKMIDAMRASYRGKGDGT